MKLHCGDKCPRTGTYNVKNKKGAAVSSIYIGEGESMPPTQYSDCHYESDESKTGRGPRPFFYKYF